MKYILFVIIAGIFLISCSYTKPRGFTYRFDNEYTGLDTLINIEGFYLSHKYCDTAYTAGFMFYPNGLFLTAGIWGNSIDKVIITFKDISTERSFTWGTYRIINDTIKTQNIFTNGWLYSPSIGESLFLILPDKKITQLSLKKIAGDVSTYGAQDFVDCSDNPCVSIGEFHPLESKRDYQDCPWLEKKWFYSKGIKRIQTLH